MDRHGFWMDLETNMVKNHTLHGHNIAIGPLEQVHRLPADTDGKLITMWVETPDRTHLDLTTFEGRYVEELVRLKAMGWETVFIHDNDIDSDTSDLWVRHHEDLDLEDVANRNTAVIRELNRMYPDANVNQDNVAHHAMAEAVRLAKRKPIHEQMLKSFEKKNLVTLIGVNDLLTGDAEVMVDLLKRTGHEVDPKDLDDWRQVRSAWAVKNRYLLNWRGLVPKWAGQIMQGRDRGIPPLDHYQFAVLQRYLMMEHDRRLEDTTRFTTGKGYHGNLRAK